MNNDELAWKFAVPYWAISADDAGTLVVGRHLCTRDGSRFGNAHIIEVNENNPSPYTVMTDAGTLVRFNEEEVHELFYVSLYISDPVSVVKRFGNPREPAKVILPDLGSPEVNDAAWQLYDGLASHGPISTGQWNNIKTIFYNAMKKALEKQL